VLRDQLVAVLDILRQKQGQILISGILKIYYRMPEMK
jgi:hypothetical protein